MSGTHIRPLIGYAGLRVLACSIVVAYHLNQLRPIANLTQWNWSLYQFTETLTIVVSFFFVLTGLGIAQNYWRTILSGAPKPETCKVFTDRFFRIAPAYYLALFASFGLWAWGSAVDMHSIGRLLSGVFFITWLSPETFFPVEMNGPLWYISFDMMGSILVFGLMSLLVRVRKIWIPVIFAAVTAVLCGLHFWFMGLHFPLMQGIMSVWFPVYNPFIFGLHFLLGVLIAGVLVWQEKIQARYSAWYDLAWLVIVGWLGYFLWEIRGTGDFEYSLWHTAYHFPFVPMLLAAMLLVTPSTVYIGKILDTRLNIFLAPLTYAVYLWHKPVMWLLGKWFFGTSEVLPMDKWWILAVLTFIGAFAVAYVTHRFVEKPVAHWWKTRQSGA